MNFKQQKTIKKLLWSSLKEEKVFKKLNIQKDALMPLLFSIRYGGSWSLKLKDLRVMAIKDKITFYDEEKMRGYTLEKVFLFLNPWILEEKGTIYRLEKCGNKKERERVKRPFKVKINAEDIIEATINPLKKKISLERIQGPLDMVGSPAYGISHEINHLNGQEIMGDPFWDIDYELEME